MVNLALSADGEVAGLPCHILIEYLNEETTFSGVVNAYLADIAGFFQRLGCESNIAQALSSACAAELSISWRKHKSEMTFAAQGDGFAFCAIKTQGSAFLLHLKTARLLNSGSLLLKNAAAAAKGLCIEELYLKIGRAKIPKNVTESINALLPRDMPDSTVQSEMLLYGEFNFNKPTQFNNPQSLDRKPNQFNERNLATGPNNKGNGNKQPEYNQPRNNQGNNQSSPQFVANKGPQQNNKEAYPDKNWTCPKCGKENTTTYCPDCGTKKPVSKEWVCPNCGEKNETKFCGECGHKRPIVSENIASAFCPTCGKKCQ